MNLQTIAEHTVDLDLLTEPSVIIDIGCRGFEFTNYFRKLNHRVYPIDIDVLHNPDYYRVAITGENGYVGVKRNKDPQATCVTEGNEIVSMTIEKFMSSENYNFVDLIKIDVEGSEKDIILSLVEPPAKQLSIEFHLHTGIYSYPEVALMVGKLKSLGYEVIQHELESRHGAGKNFWDSLFILRE